MSTPTTVDDVFNIFKRMNPLIQHASEGNVEQVRDLLAQGNAFDQAAAMGAAMCGQVECLKLFLPFSNTHNWNSALIAATMDGHETCVKALLDTQPNDWKAGVKTEIGRNTLRYVGGGVVLQPTAGRHSFPPWDWR